MKASRKLTALGRLSRFLSFDQLRILMKSFIESQFAYCPLVWMFHNREWTKINRLHERALRILYKDNCRTFNELLVKDGSISIHHRNINAVAIEIYKWVHPRKFIHAKCTKFRAFLFPRKFLHAKVSTPKVKETDFFVCNNTEKSFKINHKLDCNHKCLVYLLSCKVCGLQYV